jgi:hypothetical protein
MKILLCFLLLSLPAKADVTGAGTAEGVISIVAIPQAVALGLLPTGLSLDQDFLLSDQTMLTTLFVGAQRKLRAVTNGKEFPVKAHYNELALNISVQREGRPENKFTYIARINVDSTRALLFGRALGMPKEYAEFTYSSGGLRVEDSKQQTLATFQLKPVTNYDAAAFARNFAFMAQVQKARPLIVEHLGKFRCIDFDWNFEKAEAKPVAVQVDLSQAFAGANLPGLISPGLDSSPFGSIEIKSQWAMSGLRSCD